MQRDGVQVGIETKDFGVYRTTIAAFGDMKPRPPHSISRKLYGKILTLREEAGSAATISIVAPVIGIQNKIFRGDEEVIEVRKNFSRPDKDEGVKYHDGGIIGGDTPYNGYVMFTSDSPTLVLMGKDEEGRKAGLVIALSLAPMKTGIIDKGMALAKEIGISFTNCWIGLGIGPDKYKFDLTHPKYGEKNRGIQGWIESLEVAAPEKDGEFPINLPRIAAALVRKNGYEGEIIGLDDYLCTASATEKNGDHTFNSYARDGGDSRDVVMVAIR